MTEPSFELPTAGMVAETNLRMADELNDRVFSVTQVYYPRVGGRKPWYSYAAETGLPPEELADNDLNNLPNDTYQTTEVVIPDEGVVVADCIVGAPRLARLIWGAREYVIYNRDGQLKRAPNFLVVRKLLERTGISVRHIEDPVHKYQLEQPESK